jgi:hypothetical protein
MICHYCNREAPAKCISCGLAICPEHGTRYCHVCSGAVFSRERTEGEREEQLFLQCPPKPRMETIYLDDDDGPPECYCCPALARHVCADCHNLYCRDHAGVGQFCGRCAKGARLGNWIIAGILLAFAVLTGLVLLLNRNPGP